MEGESPADRSRELTERQKVLAMTLDHLLRITREMHMLSSLILVSAFGGLLLTIATIALGDASGRGVAPIRTMFGLLCAGAGMSGLIWAFRFEATRKRGDVFFEEISNELQWHLGREPRSAGPTHKPAMDYRIVLRTFVKTSDLPLAPGKMGPTYYAIVFLAIAAVGGVQVIRGYFLS